MRQMSRKNNSKKRSLALVMSLLLLTSGLYWESGKATANDADVQAEEADNIEIMAASDAVGIGVTYHTQQEIRDYMAKKGAKESDPVTYSTTPVATKPYAPGKVSDTTLKSALAMLNQIRYVAGLPEVTLDTSKTEMMQASALVQAANQGLSHTPPRPSGMSDALYNKGYEGSGMANLAWGFRTLNSAVLGWMSDEDDYNIGVVGHRRWVLNPEMGKTTFGAVNKFYSMYAFDFSAQSDITGVIWPAQQMPIEYFADDIPWSYSYGDFVDASKVKVTLTRKKDGKVWRFNTSSSNGFFAVDNNWYGQPGCIIFRPNNISYAVGDVFDVEITGLPTQVRYTVTFFDQPTQPKYEISLNKSSATLATLKTLQLTATVSPSDYTGTITWSSSDTKVASVDANGKVTANRYGTAVITAKLSNGAKATCKIQTRFYDVAGSNDKSKPNYQYYYDAVYWAADNGITTGYDKVYFGPERECERREMLIFLWRIAGCPTGYGDARDYFNDLDSTDFEISKASNKAIAWAYKAGITKGYSDGGFHPYSTITRGETMILLYRVAGKPAVSGEITFPDVVEQNYSPKSDTYKAILWGSQKKITSGYSDGTFRPFDNCLREAIVTFLYRYSKLK